MRIRQATWMRHVTLAVGTASFLAPPSVLRAQDALVEPLSLVATDVALADDGLLTVRAIDSAGKPAGGRHVRLLAHGETVASVTTDSSGVFQVSGLREGLHEIEVDSSSTSVRLWEEGSAPPHAESAVSVVCPDPCQPACPPRTPARPHRGPLKRAYANYPLATKLLIGAGIGAAIAIPIAVSQRPASP